MKYFAFTIRAAAPLAAAPLVTAPAPAAAPPAAILLITNLAASFALAPYDKCGAKMIAWPAQIRSPVAQMILVFPAATLPTGLPLFGSPKMTALDTKAESWALSISAALWTSCPPCLVILSDFMVPEPDWNCLLLTSSPP